MITLLCINFAVCRRRTTDFAKSAIVREIKYNAATEMGYILFLAIRCK